MKYTLKINTNDIKTGLPIVRTISFGSKKAVREFAYFSGLNHNPVITIYERDLVIDNYVIINKKLVSLSNLSRF